jgi:hypothetical protein
MKTMGTPQESGIQPRSPLNCPRSIGLLVCLLVLTPLIAVSYRGSPWWIHASAVIGLGWIYPLLAWLSFVASQKLISLQPITRPGDSFLRRALLFTATTLIGMVLFGSLLILDEVLRSVSVYAAAAWLSRLLRPDRGVLLMILGVAFSLLVRGLARSGVRENGSSC